MRNQDDEQESQAANPADDPTGDDMSSHGDNIPLDPQALVETMDDDLTPSYDLNPVDIPATDPQATFDEVEDQSDSGSSVFPDTTSRHAQSSKTFSGDSQPRLVTTSHRAFSIEASYANMGEIARGNMGAIIRTRDRDIERDVALKVMLDKKSNPESRMRFLREAQITGQLEHPNIVPIHCLGTDTHGNPVFSMKLVHGITVDQVIEDTIRKKRKTIRDWPLETLVATLIPVCHAIEFAHSKGVIHRDLKPSNVMLGDFGEVLVMDWGLAKAGVSGNIDTRRVQAPIHRIMDERRQRRKGLTARRLDGTADGAVIGTPKYMSPEQARGEVDNVDPRTDVYALGAVLYDILALAPPVSGDTIDDILDRVAAGDIVPPGKLNPKREIPKELSAIAMKALSWDPRNRYQCVADFRADLERWREHRSVSAKEDTSWEVVTKLLKRNRTTAAVAIIAVAILAATMALGYWSNTRERGRVQEALAEIQAENLEHAAELKELAPVVLAAARAALPDDLPTAISRCRQAIAFDDERLDSQLLLARLYIITGAFASAELTLEEAKRMDSLDTTIDTLMALCRRARHSAPGSYTDSFAAIFDARGDSQCSDLLRQRHEQRFETLRLSLSNEMPGARLDRDDQGRWRLRAQNLPNPLAIGGMPLQVIVCDDSATLFDCDILHGMPLQELHLHNAINLADLNGLRGMDLDVLTLNGAEILDDISPLHGMPLRELTISDAPLTDINALGSMPLNNLSLIRCQEITNYAPLRGLPLQRCAINHSPQFADTAIFMDMPLIELSLRASLQINDLRPLAALKLETLDLAWCSRVVDLQPLAKLPLRRLHLAHCEGISDLTPLRDLRLEQLTINPDRITAGLDAVQAMDSLRQIGVSEAQLQTPAAFWQQHGLPRPAIPKRLNNDPDGDL